MRSTRARLAACTALALAAGTFLAGTASAGTPAPRPAADRPERASTAPPSTRPVLPARPASGELRAGIAAAPPVGASPQLSDFDGDGLGDLIFRTWDGDVHTAPSSEKGGVLLKGAGQPVKDVIPIGNQDGNASHPEVLTLSAQGALTLYADATPTAATYAWQGQGWQIYNKVLAPGDVNDDGRADLLARDHDGNLYLYYATGNRAAPFSPRMKLGGGWNIYDQLLGIGDDNGDGWADVLGRDSGGGLWFYPGRGDKAKPFGTPVRIGGGWGGYNQLVPVGDDNGDGNGDLLARDAEGTLWFYAGKGGGAFAGRAVASAPGGWADVPQFGGAGNNPVTGDKEGVLARDNAGSMYWYGSTTGGRLGDRAPYGDPGTWAGVYFSHLTSLNTDGFSDTAVVFRGELFVEGRSFGKGWDAFSVLVGPGDLTGDGKADLLARDRSGALYLYPGNGQGTGFGARVKLGAGWNAYDRIVGAGDYTGDGRPDLVGRTSGGELYLYAGTGVAKAPFRDRVRIGTGWNTYKQLVAPGDLNADGKADLLGVASNGDLYRYLNTAPGKFSDRYRIGTGFQIYNAIS